MGMNDIKVSDNFMLYEFESPDTHEVIIHAKLIRCTQNLRNIYGAFTPNSAYRTKAHNKVVGGEPNSYHLKGMAIDVPLKKGWTVEQLAEAGRKAGFNGIGLYNTFVHMDIGTKRTFDKRG